MEVTTLDDVTEELSDSNGIRTHNHLGRKQTLNRLRTDWLWVWILLLSHKLQISRQFWAKSSLKFRQLYIVDSLWKLYVTW